MKIELKTCIYHVTFGAGNASHVSDNVPLCPRSTLVSDKGCVMLRGAKQSGKVIASGSHSYV
jgi:hypothetical protein